MPELLTNERPILSVRQHWSMVVPPIVAIAIVTVIVTVLLHFVPAAVASHSTSTVVNGLRLLVVVVAFMVALTLYLQWRAAVYLLTDRRIVVTRGVVSKVTESITLDRIQDVIKRQSLIERMIDAGDVVIESAGRDGVEVLHRIPKPAMFYTSLMDAVENHRTGGAAGGAATAVVQPPPSAPV